MAGAPPHAGRASTQAAGEVKSAVSERRELEKVGRDGFQRFGGDGEKK